MNSERIDVLDEADGDHIAFAVSYYFELEFFPSEDGLLDKNLTYKGSLKTSCADGL